MPNTLGSLFKFIPRPKAIIYKIHAIQITLYYQNFEFFENLKLGRLKVPFENKI